MALHPNLTPVGREAAGSSGASALTAEGVVQARVHMLMTLWSEAAYVYQAPSARELGALVTGNGYVGVLLVGPVHLPAGAVPAPVPDLPAHDPRRLHRPYGVHTREDGEAPVRRHGPRPPPPRPRCRKPDCRFFRCVQHVRVVQRDPQYLPVAALQQHIPATGPRQLRCLRL